jgi:hypothetical protein
MWRMWPRLFYQPRFEMQIWWSNDITTWRNYERAYWIRYNGFEASCSSGPNFNHSSPKTASQSDQQSAGWRPIQRWRPRWYPLERTVENQHGAIVDIRVTDTDANAYKHQNPHDVLRNKRRRKRICKCTHQSSNTASNQSLHPSSRVRSPYSDQNSTLRKKWDMCSYQVKGSGFNNVHSSTES